jgi:hypothetical protein
MYAVCVVLVVGPPKARREQAIKKRSSGEVFGDAGEHYALSQFSSAGKFAAKMPDDCEAYDLVVEPGQGPLRVSVKTKSESAG